jgi:hypothetical protein
MACSEQHAVPSGTPVIVFHEWFDHSNGRSIDAYDWEAIEHRSQVPHETLAWSATRCAIPTAHRVFITGRERDE